MFLLWLRVAAGLYGVAGAAAVPAVFSERRIWKQVCLPAALIAFFFHFVAVAETLMAAHRWKPVGMNEVQSLLALLIAAAFLLVWVLYRTVSFGLFALPLAFLLVLIPSIGQEHYTFSSQAVRSGWIVVHVTGLLAAYAALIFSLLASWFYLLQENRLKSKRGGAFLTWLPPLETMDQIAHRSLFIGFQCMTAGLLAGSLIAQERYGASYFSDPKVVLSFVMWLLYVVLLFIRRSKGLRGRRAVYLSSAVVLVAISVWAANQFSSVHRFGAP